MNSQNQLVVQSIVKCSDECFDSMNIRNINKIQKCISNQKPFLKLYTSVDDERFAWLMSTLYGCIIWVIFQIGKGLY